MDLDLLFLLSWDLDRLRITTDLERARLAFLTDLDLDRLVRETGVLFRERDLECLPLRRDLDRDLERRFFRRETDCFDLERECLVLPVDLDLER